MGLLSRRSGAGLREDQVQKAERNATPDMQQLRRRALVGRIDAVELSRAWCAKRRKEVIAWLTRVFAGLSLQDSWLSATVALLDRSAAAVSPTSAPSGEDLGPWILAAVLLILKLSEAEAALACDPGDAVLAMSARLPSGWRSPSRSAFRQSLASAEQQIMRVLDYQVAAPSCYDLVEHMAILLHTPKCASQVEYMDAMWPGFQRMSFLVARRKLKDVDNNASSPEECACVCVEKAAAKYMQQVEGLGHGTQAFKMLSTYLLELAITHAPHMAYGTKSPLMIVVVSSLVLAISAFPSLPTCWEAHFESELREIIVTAEFERLMKVVVEMEYLWAQPPEYSEVVRKWRTRVSSFPDPNMDFVINLVQRMATTCANLDTPFESNELQAQEVPHEPINSLASPNCDEVLSAPTPQPQLAAPGLSHIATCASPSTPKSKTSAFNRLPLLSDTGGLDHLVTTPPTTVPSSFRGTASPHASAEGASRGSSALHMSGTSPLFANLRAPLPASVMGFEADIPTRARSVAEAIEQAGIEMDEAGHEDTSAAELPRESQLDACEQIIAEHTALSEPQVVSETARNGEGNAAAKSVDPGGESPKTEHASVEACGDLVAGPTEDSDTKACTCAPSRSGAQSPSKRTRLFSSIEARRNARRRTRSASGPCEQDSLREEGRVANAIRAEPGQCESEGNRGSVDRCECEPSTHDSGNQLQLCLVEPISLEGDAEPLNDDSSLQHQLCLVEPTGTAVSAELPSAEMLPTRGLAMIEGGACQTLGVWSIAGVWRKESWQETEIFPFEWKASSSLPQGEGPLKGRYTGYFYHKSGERWQKYEEQELVLSFTPNAAGSLNVSGHGWNEMCIFSIVGLMELNGNVWIVKTQANTGEGQGVHGCSKCRWRSSGCPPSCHAYRAKAAARRASLPALGNGSVDGASQLVPAH